MMMRVGLTLWCLLAPVYAWASSGIETPPPTAWQVGQGTLTRQAVLKDPRGDGFVALSCFTVDGTPEKLVKIIIRHRGLVRRIQAPTRAQLRIYKLRTLAPSNRRITNHRRIALRTFTPDRQVWSVLSPGTRSLTARLLGAGYIDLVPTPEKLGSKTIRFGPIANPDAFHAFLRDCN